MKVARLHSFGDIRIEDMPVPEVGPSDALMRTRASGVCTGEVMPWYVERKAPLVLGHEPAGEIVRVGDDVTALRPGNRVFVHHHAACGACRTCLRGDHVQCARWAATSIHPGGMAEYVLIPGENLERDTLLLPQGVSFEDATLVEPLACAVKSLRRARVREGDTVLVIGLGVMGMLHLLILGRFGAGRVIGADRVSYRLRKARELGAHQVIDARETDVAQALAGLTDGALANVVIVGPGSVEALRTGLACAGPGGTVVMFTPLPPEETLALSPNDMYFRDMSLVASYSCGPAETREALALIEEGVVRSGQVVTHRFPIGEAAEAYRLTAEGRDSLKCLVIFP
jgi:L-iditol 2-dehydrogenase